MVPGNDFRSGGLSGGALLRFWKVQSIGNDFPLIHLEDVASDELPELAIRLSNRRFGIGGDGLLAVGMEGPALRVRMFNPDGTEDFCGNGLRCAALHAHQRGWVGDEFTMLHLGQKVSASVDDGLIRTTLPPATYQPERIPVRFSEDPGNTFDRVVFENELFQICGSVLSTGTAHTVVPGPLPGDAVFFELGPAIEVAPQFPERTSVMWAEEVGANVLQLRIWERGVGETLGCGTGSTAAAVDYLRRHNTGGTVEVRNPGGTLWISADRWDGPVTLSGKAFEVFEGQLP